MRDRQVRLGQVVSRALGVDDDFIRLLVQPHEHLALADAVVVVHKNADDLARHAGGHESEVAIDVGVVGGDGVQRPRHYGSSEVRAPGNRRDRGRDDGRARAG